MKIGLVITTYNRPECLRQTLDSLLKCIFPKEFEIYIIDDCSSNFETRKLIEGFSIPNIKITKVYNDKNKGMFYGLKSGFDYLLNNGCEVFMNLDSDAIVKPYWIAVLIKLYELFPEHIISGFNTLCHPISSSFSKYYTKKDIGGINMVFGKGLHSLVCSTLHSNNWDWDVCKKMQDLKTNFIVSRPSVLQHISNDSVARPGSKQIDRAEDWVPAKNGVCYKKVKKIMFVHASRGRPQRGPDAAANMIKHMKSGTPFTYYFSLDSDDPTLAEYKENISKLGFVNDVVISENNGCVEATNKAAARYNDEDLIIVNADDIGIKEDGWDIRVLDFIEKTISANEYMVHFPNETANSKQIAIYQFISGDLYKKLGYVFHPGYISMYADNDLWATCTRLGVRYDYTSPPNPHLFSHDHPSNGVVAWDETYKRTGRPICYQVGQELYSKREKQNFPIK